MSKQEKHIEFHSDIPANTKYIPTQHESHVRFREDLLKTLEVRLEDQKLQFHVDPYNERLRCFEQNRKKMYENNHLLVPLRGCLEQNAKIVRALRIVMMLRMEKPMSKPHH